MEGGRGEAVRELVNQSELEFDKDKGPKAHCTKCSRKMVKSSKRPNSKYNWSCDGCLKSHPVRPGFEFYSCKYCDMDWCNSCFHRVEEKVEVKRFNELSFNTSIKSSISE